METTRYIWLSLSLLNNWAAVDWCASPSDKDLFPTETVGKSMLIHALPNPHRFHQTCPLSICVSIVHRATTTVPFGHDHQQAQRLFYIILHQGGYLKIVKCHLSQKQAVIIYIENNDKRT